MQGKTSGHAIVKNSDGDEENVKAGENNEEKVEGVPHLLGGQYKNNQNVAQNTKTANKGLKIRDNIHKYSHSIHAESAF